MRESFYSLAGCPCKIALVSDLHEKPWDAVLDSLKRNRPALICVPGDFFFGRLPKEEPKVREAGVLPFFAACAALAPCYVSLGNHEWLLTKEDAALVAGTGAVLLDNTYTVTGIEGRRLVLGGLTSARVSEFRRAFATGLSVLEANEQTRPVGVERHVPPLLSWLDGYCAEPGYHILLCHHPEYYPRWLKGRPIDLILSGHAHGGQIRILGQGLFAPGQGVLPRLTSGVKDGRLVISRGLANCQRVPRLFNSTELVYVMPGL